MICPIEKLLDECRLEPLAYRRKCRRLTMIFKMFRGECPTYLQNMLPEDRMAFDVYSLRDLYSFNPVLSNYAYYRCSFLPRSISEWNQLDNNVKAVSSISLFKKSLQSKFNVNPLLVEINRKSSILHTQLRYDCSPLRQHRFRVNLCETRSCSCGGGYENTRHFLLVCTNYTMERREMFNAIRAVTDRRISLKLLLFGHDSLNSDVNNRILESVQRFICDTSRFE